MNTDRKILAVDNDENALYNLRQGIKDIYPSANIAAFCEVTQVLTYLNEREHRKLDYAFLDTCLRGLSGIELARVIREYNPKTKIIFCTEHSENALEAFSVHAAAYINTKTGEVDTGVVLNNMPYILVLAVLAAGVVVFIIRKRRED